MPLSENIWSYNQKEDPILLNKKIWEQLSSLKDDMWEVYNIDINNEEKGKIRELFVPLDLLMWEKANFKNVHKLHKTIIEVQSSVEDYFYEKFDIKDWWFISRLLFWIWITAFYFPGWANSSIVTHELGHWIFSSSGNPNSDYWIWDKEWLTLWELFLKWVSSPFDIRYFNWKTSSEESILWSWINFNTEISRHNYEDKIRWKDTSITKELDYWFNKIYWIRSNVIPSTSTWWDITRYTKKLDISQKELLNYQLVSTLLSWWTLSAIKNWVWFLKDWTLDNNPLSVDFNWTKVYAPEFNVWLNSENFSLETLTYIQKGELIYKLWLDTPIKWKWDNIITMWISKQQGNNYYSGDIKSNWKQNSLNISVEVAVTKDSNIIFDWNITDKWFLEARNFGNNTVSATYSIAF